MEQPVTEVPQNEMPRDSSLSAQLGLLVQQMRVRQWPKNLIIFVPLLFSGKSSDLQSVIYAFVCFSAFCLISSGIYIFNDIMDVAGDRAHPVKKLRPIASGRLSIRLATVTGVSLLVVGGILAVAVRPSLVLVCVGYVVLNLIYSLGLKNVAILDVMCISSGFVFRAVAGAVAVRVFPSAWFLLCTTLGALFLALEKRRQELVLLAGDSSSHRKALSDYSLPLLMRLEGIVVPTLVTAYSFYTFQAPHGQWMMMTIPVVLYGIMRYQLLSEKGTTTGTPEEVLLKDRPIQMTLILWVLLCALVVYGHPRDIVLSIAKFVDSLRPVQ
jgi:4-hydroxybenzoate polyprenyltransferase